MKLRKLPVLAAVSLSLLFASAASFGSNGRENLLDNVVNIKAGVTTSQQVRELLGPPGNTMRLPARGLNTMEYEVREYSELVTVSIAIGNDGIVRDVMQIRRSHP